MSDAAEKQDSTQKGVQGNSQAVRVLVVLNHKKSLASGLSFLNRRGYQIVIVHHIVEALKRVQAIRPHIILISWNLKKTDVRKAYKLFNDKLKIMVIAFAEDNNTRTAASLMSSGIPNTLLAPVSGPGIHMRIQALLRLKKNAYASAERAASAAMATEAATQVGNDNPVEVRSGDVPSETVWEKAIDGAKSADGHHMWRGVKTNQGKSGSVFYFKGPESPTYNPTKQKWENFDKGGPIMKQGGVTSQIMSITQEGMAKGTEYSLTQEGLIGEDFNVTQSAPKGTEFQFENSPPINLEKDLSAIEEELFDASKNDESEPEDISEGGEELSLNEFDALAETYEEQKENSPESAFKESPGNVQVQVAKEKQSILVQSVKDSVENYAIPANVIPVEFGSFTKVLAMTIETFRFKGYLIFISSNDQPNSSWLEQVFNLVQTKMKDYGEPINPTKKMEMIVPPIDFKKWADGGPEFLVTAQHGEDKIAFAYLPIANIPAAIDNAKDAVSDIDLETNLVGNSELLFDLYLHLPKNDKFILYLKKNTVLTQNTLEKLLNFGIKTVYVKTQDKHLFLTYCARNRVIASAKHIETS